MQNNINPSNFNAFKQHKDSLNQDANAALIDQMLVNIRILIKKVLQFKKYLKQYLQPGQITGIQIEEKISIMQNQTKNLSLSIAKNIISDKRMTNLFYMRIQKQLAYYKSVIPSLMQILPILQEKYSDQRHSQNVSIIELYLICQKKIIQQINMIKRKIVACFQQIKKTKIDDKKLIYSPNKTTPTLNNKIFLQNQQFMNEKNSKQFNLLMKQSNKQSMKLIQQSQKAFIINSFVQFDYFNKVNGNLMEFIVDKFAQKNKKVIQRTSNVLKSFSQIQNSQKRELFLDFKQKINQLFMNTYGCLDISQPQITEIYVPTLKPQDNIDIIYRKVIGRNKKMKKQVKQFQDQYALYAYRKQQHQKRRARRSQLKQQNTINKRNIRINRISHSGGSQKYQTLQTRKQSRNITQDTLDKQKYDTIKSTQFVTKSQNIQKYKFKSRFRQRIQSTISTTKVNSSNVLVIRPKNLQPINQKSLNIKNQPKLKKIQSVQSIEFRNKQNYLDKNQSSKKLLKRQKSFDIKKPKSQKKSKHKRFSPQMEVFSKKLKL